MLDGGIACLRPEEHPIVHTDRGCHYRWPGWISRMEAADLTRSMSKKGCSPDNAACEGFFGIVKSEMFYTRSWDGVSVEEFVTELDSYIRWSNVERIKLSLGGKAQSPTAKALDCWNSQVQKNVRTPGLSGSAGQLGNQGFHEWKGSCTRQRPYRTVFP